MALDKAIEHKKEHRKPYRGGKAIDYTCRNHGGCDWCLGNRLYSTRKRIETMNSKEEEYMAEKLGAFSTKAEELKKLVAEHPDYQIVVAVGYEVVGSEDFAYWYAPHVSCRVGEFLNCDVDGENIYFDRDELEEYLEEIMEYDEPYINMTDDEFAKALEEKIHEYDEYWTPAIIIYAEV